DPATWRTRRREQWTRERPSVGDADAHGTGGAGNDLGGGVGVVGVEVDHLALGDLADLVLGERPDLVGVRRTRTLADACRLLDELGGRRGLGDEGEGTVFVDRDLHRDDVATLRLGGRVV